MSVTCEPDVSRVLAKLGRQDFTYLSFGNGPIPPVTAPLGSAETESLLIQEQAQHHTPAPPQDSSQAQSVAVVFSLLEAALPEAAQIQWAPTPSNPSPVPDDPPTARPAPNTPGSAAPHAA